MVFHKRFRRKLPTLVNGDLSPIEEAKLRRHIAMCSTCRTDVEELQQLNRLVSECTGPAFEEQELLEARGQLNSWLAASRTVYRPSFADGPRRLLHRYPVLAPAVLLCVLSLGVLAGRYLFPMERVGHAGLDSTGAKNLTDLNEVGMSNLQIIGGMEEGSDIEIAVDVTRTVHLRGAPGDPMIQRVLARAIVGGENPGIRMRAAANAFHQTGGAGDQEIKAALMLAMKNDPNDGVRKAAIEALLRYPPEREIRDGLVHVLLADENPGLRVAAVNGLSVMAAQGMAADQDMRGNLETHLRSEENLFVRTKTESLLKGRIQ